MAPPFIAGGNSGSRSKATGPPPRRSYSSVSRRELSSTPDVDDDEMPDGNYEVRQDSDAESEEDDGREWQFDNENMGEFIDNEGNKWHVNSIDLVTWYDWRSKKTGLQSTWVNSSQFRESAPRAVMNHENKHRRDRLDIAAKSTSIILSEVCSRVWHSIENREHKAALMEKLDTAPFYDPEEIWADLPQSNENAVDQAPASSASTTRTPGPVSSAANRQTGSRARRRRVYSNNGTKAKFEGRAATPEGMPYPVRTHKYKDITARRPAESTLAAVPDTPIRFRTSRLPGEVDPFAAENEVISLGDSIDSDEDHLDISEQNNNAEDEGMDIDVPDEDGIRRGNRRKPQHSAVPILKTTRRDSNSSHEMSPHHFRPAGPRAELQPEWDKKTVRAKAAKIVICGKNVRDRESIPDVPLRFVYMENDYIYSASTYDIDPKHLAEDDFSVCHHGTDCKNPPEGDCCIRRKRNMDASLAYDNQGRWRFKIDKFVKVLECNRFCECDKKICPHSVSQRPRQHVIELFDTGVYGWGVRTPKDLPRGTILGIFTGELITRAIAEDREAASSDSSYIFDLDHDEGEDDDTNTSGWSVDARECGNWTRFINHSCSPNLETYTVQFDAPYMSEHPGKLVFVTSKSIDAGTELTLDYYPQYDPRIGRPPGRKSCHCRERNCRGWR
ncbi:SET domain-containing protein [Dacryopinax primogenitus]|uniref:SET domain-containing protein n=1 Tax=Dacryopinax primogenitus (strain DJM 731) TaxID=1858805 RepID=M5G9U0_DACPD|nr:SET domain-containing protein [Dacryopinax primogenitus]EJU05065.1 SET domain-containing protein [Dacryopinax primogenitus]